MTHGHERKVGNVGGRQCAGWRGLKGGKWDSCNSIINKIYLKKNPGVKLIKKFYQSKSSKRSKPVMRLSCFKIKYFT